MKGNKNNNKFYFIACIILKTTIHWIDSRVAELIDASQEVSIYYYSGTPL